MEEEKRSTLVASCLPEDKGRWVRAAQKRKMKLTEWVNEACNEKEQRERQDDNNKSND